MTNGSLARLPIKAGLSNRLLSQFGQVGLNVDDYVDGAGEPAVKGVFELFRDFVGGGDTEGRVNEYMQVEKNLPADGAGSEVVILSNLVVGTDNLLYLPDGVFIDGTFGQLTNRFADYIGGYRYNHYSYRNRGHLVAEMESELHCDDSNQHRNRA